MGGDEVLKVCSDKSWLTFDSIDRIRNLMVQFVFVYVCFRYRVIKLTKYYQSVAVVSKKSNI